MFSVIVYSFIKKENSTKRVTVQDALTNTEMDCNIITDSCGIITPMIEINYGTEKSPTNFNYAYIPIFKRYYFVTDWETTKHSLWRGHLQEDFLATWKEDILNYEAYVLRSASRFNTLISDNAYVATAQISVISNEIPNPYNASGQGELPAGYQGEYVIGIIGVNDMVDSSMGSVTYYVFSANQAQLLANALLKNIDYLKVDFNGDAKKFITPELLRCLFNPIQYIASCKWFPIFPSDKGTQVTSIKIGFWELNGIICRQLKTNELYDTNVRNISIPKHPQSGDYGQWLNLAPYSYYQLHVAPYGLLDLPADDIINSTEIAVEVVEDFVTGVGRIMVAAAGVRFIQIVNFQYGIDVQISQLTQNGIGAMLSGMQYSLSHNQGHNLRVAQNLSPFNLGGLANTMMGTVEADISFIGDLVTAMTPTIQSQGANGSRAAYYTGEGFWRLSGKFVHVTKRGDAVKGRPLCEMARLGDLSGYTLCENASVPFEGDMIEQQVVNAYLNRGFYIE